MMNFWNITKFMKLYSTANGPSEKTYESWQMNARSSWGVFGNYEKQTVFLDELGEDGVRSLGERQGGRCWG